MLCKFGYHKRYKGSLCTARFSLLWQCILNTASSFLSKALLYHDVPAVFFLMISNCRALLLNSTLESLVPHLQFFCAGSLLKCVGIDLFGPLLQETSSSLHSIFSAERSSNLCKQCSLAKCSIFIRWTCPSKPWWICPTCLPNSQTTAVYKLVTNFWPHLARCFTSRLRALTAAAYCSCTNEH